MEVKAEGETVHDSREGDLREEGGGGDFFFDFSFFLILECGDKWGRGFWAEGGIGKNGEGGSVEGIW